MNVVPWEFQMIGGILYPRDEELTKKAVAFCKANLTVDLDPRKFHKLWIVLEEEEVVAVSGIRNCWDIAVFRSIDEQATAEMANRLNSFFADNGLRGQEVFLFLSERETVEQRCPNREAILRAWGAEPAERYAATVR